MHLFCAERSAASAAAKRQTKVSAKLEENAEGSHESAASKADLMRDSDPQAFADVGWVNNP